MKTLRYFAFAAAILAAACAKEEPAPEQHSVKEITFTADNGGNYTKTQLVENENGAAVEWCGGDKISVFDGAAVNREFTTENGGATATFSGKATEVAKGGYWYAVYPYAAANSISGTTITTTLPDVQVVVSNAVADGVNVTAAKSATTAFSFKNLCGLIRVAVPADFAELKSITINSDKAIAGEFTVDCSGEVPVFAAAGAEAVKSVTLSKKDGSALSAGNWYVAAFPGTHNISIVLTDNADKKVILGGNVNVKVQASKITGMGEVDTDVFTHSTVLVKAGDDLQAAINAANAGDRLLLAAGTYTGNFTLKDGVNISGGWNATYTVCDPNTYKTVLDGNKAGRVLTQSAAFENTTVISGLGITNGENSAEQKAGGAYINKGVILENCEIYDNKVTKSDGQGGGVWAEAEAIIRNCHIHNNYAQNTGGGAVVKGQISYCIIENNNAPDNVGGGLQIHGGSAASNTCGTMFNCIVRNNSSKNGGGIRSYNYTQIANCLIVGNTATSGGISGILCNNNAAAVVNCTIANNYDAADAAGNSSGLYINANGTIKNCIVYGNYSKSKVADQAVQVYINNQYTWLKNNAVHANGLKKVDNYDPNGNGRDTDTQTIASGTSIFTDAANGDFTLTSAATMCIDKGNTSIYGFMTTDLAGNSRTVDTIDIGCYEYQK